MTTNPFAGVFAPLVTVFDHEENLDLDAIRQNIRFYNCTALHGYMPLGSNGEFQGLEDREALEILNIVAENKDPEKVVVAGCGRESVSKTVSFIRQATEYGLDYAFILPPHYFVQQTSMDGILRFYYAVADRSPIPLVAYNAPKFASGMILTPEIVAQLARHPNIHALKNSSEIPNRNYVEVLPEEGFSLIAGNISNFYSGLCAGAVGGVLSTASYLPEYCCQLYDLFTSGNVKQARTLSVWLQKIAAQTAGLWGVAGVKAAMQLRGLSGGSVRLPLMSMPQEQIENMAQVFAEYKIPHFPADPACVVQGVECGEMYGDTALKFDAVKNEEGRTKAVKRCFTIGETANILGTTTRTLRHYEKIGILSPSEKDTETGYRHYSLDQFHYFDRIRYLQSFGMPLMEIKNIFDAGGIEALSHFLEIRYKECQDAVDKIQKIERSLQWYIQYFQTQSRSKNQTIYQRQLSDRYALCVPCYPDEPVDAKLLRLAELKGRKEYEDLIYRRQYAITLDFEGLKQRKYIETGYLIYLEEKPKVITPYIKKIPAGSYLCYWTQMKENHWCDEYDSSWDIIIKSIAEIFDSPLVLANEYETSLHQYDASEYEIQIYTD